MTTAISAIRADYRTHASLYRSALESALHDPTSAIDELRSLAAVTPFRRLQEKCWRAIIRLQDEHRSFQLYRARNLVDGVPCAPTFFYRSYYTDEHGDPIAVDENRL